MADTEALVKGLGECAERGDFEGAFELVRANRAELAKSLQPSGVRDALKKTTKDRLLLSFLDGVEFDSAPLDTSIARIGKLVSFKPGSLVLNKAWGLGEVKKIDDFYRRITVDFDTRRGHQFTYMAACDMLDLAPDGHVLVLRKKDPAGFALKLRENPGEFVKLVLSSYGDMPIVRLEDVCERNGFVRPAEWKKFWDSARAGLRRDKCVEIPSRRADPIRLRAALEDYGEGWAASLSRETDPKSILAAVRECVAEGKFASAGDEMKKKIGERLVFASTAARNVDDALYVRIACEISSLGFSDPPADEMRAYLWERRRYVKAAAELPAREVGAMVRFLSVDAESRERLYAAIPDLCFAAVSEIISQLGGEPGCRNAVAAFLRDPKAPATLVTLLVGKVDKKGWGFSAWTELPPLITILSHAIALGEGRQGGETLKMQNIVRRLFASTDWLSAIFPLLSPEERVLFFERFQASIAWDPSTHHTIVVRMTRIAPELAPHLVKTEKKREYARITSYRSFGLRKRDYLKLINEDMPANIKRIEFAKSYGDLSENAEYQYAKDEQRALMQKQSLMQEELEAVKPGDFSDATTDEVMPGVTVVADTKDGEKSWTILGEWDNDLDMGIISSKTRVAQNLLGKKVGDDFELPDSDGNATFAKVREIRPLSDEIKDWMKLPEGVQI